jgi:hypothetical protein
MPSPNKNIAGKYIDDANKLQGRRPDTMPDGVWCTALGLVQEFVSKFQLALGEIGEQESGQAAAKFKWFIQNVVERQRYQWKPLSKRYLEWKKRHKRDTRILIATREYIQSVRIMKHDVGSWHDDRRVVWYEVGLPPIIHVDSGLPLRKLAAIHEFGVPKKNIPARPLWQPAAWEFSKKHSGKVLKRIRAKAMKVADPLFREITKAQGL